MLDSRGGTLDVAQMRDIEKKARIQWALKRRGKTQRDVKELAEELAGDDVSEGLVSRVIAGDLTEGEKVEAVKKAAARLAGCSMEELWGAE